MESNYAKLIYWVKPEILSLITYKYYLWLGIFLELLNFNLTEF